MATDRKSWQRVIWLLLPCLYMAGIIIDLNMRMCLLQVGTTEMYVACVWQVPVESELWHWLS
jgi:hypothetical protein